MTRIFTLIVFLLSIYGGPALATDSEAVAAARQTMDQFMLHFNNRDLSKLANETLHYPHVRIASGEVQVTASAEAFVAQSGPAIEALIEHGWHHSRWDDLTVVQESPDKVHFAVTFTRFRADDTVLSAFESFYVVTKKDEHWRVQARSSFAP